MGKKMCEYCKEVGKFLKGKSRKCDIFGQKMSSSAFVDCYPPPAGNLTFMVGEETAWNGKINYCPMCGRKLGE